MMMMMMMMMSPESVKAGPMGSMVWNISGKVSEKEYEQWTL